MLGWHLDEDGHSDVHVHVHVNENTVYLCTMQRSLRGPKCLTFCRKNFCQKMFYGSFESCFGRRIQKEVLVLMSERMSKEKIINTLIIILLFMQETLYGCSLPLPFDLFFLPFTVIGKKFFTKPLFWFAFSSIYICHHRKEYKDTKSMSLFTFVDSLKYITVHTLKGI